MLHSLKIAGLSWAIGLLALSPLAVKADNSDILDSKPAQVEPDNLLYQAILSAKMTLQARVNDELTNPKFKPVVVKSKNTPIPVTLALWQPVADQIVFVNGLKSGRRVTLNDNRNYDIKVKYDNGVNSQYIVAGEPKALVVAVIHPIYLSLGAKTRSQYKLQNTVYVPYHDYLKTAAIIDEGKRFFATKITAVYDEIAALGVKSQAYPDKLLIDVIDPILVKSIIAIEHADNISRTSSQPAEFLDRFFVTLATNRHFSFAYSKSTASARGLAQFIPSTYKLMVKRRPELVLNPNFEQGMTDPYNAIKAEIGYLDDILSHLPQTIKNAGAADDKKLGAYLAASYNGGLARVIKAFEKWGDNWSASRVTLKKFYQQEKNTYLAGVKSLKQQLTGKQITTLEKAKLKQQLKIYKQHATAADQFYNLVNRYALKNETAYYIVKYNLIYDLLKAPNVIYSAALSKPRYAPS